MQCLLVGFRLSSAMELTELYTREVGQAGLACLNLSEVEEQVVGSFAVTSFLPAPSGIPITLRSVLDSGHA